MRIDRRACLLVPASALLGASLAAAQLPAVAGRAGDATGGAPVLSQRVQSFQPFSVAGPRGVLLGQQNGTFEAWVLPVKLLSQVHLTAQVQDYPVPLDLNSMAAEVEVAPGHTTITYSHIAVTVRQTMFSPESGPAGTGALVLFIIDAVRPVTLTLSFTPEMRPMWPKPGGGAPSAEWVEPAHAYLLHTDTPDLTGAVALPGAEPGVMAPYQERPQTHPLEFRLRYDPAQDRGRTYPLLMAMGQTAATAGRDTLLARLAELQSTAAASLQTNEARYAALGAELTSIHTPDSALDGAFQWAGLAVEQLRARLEPTGETGLVAGYYASGDSARPGFGWFFGRDALYTVPAIDAIGDFRLTRQSLDFLLARQRADGKMMHEYSQTANQVDWASTPYLYAAADATPLFLLAMLDYLHTSGDTAYVQKHRDAILRAWQFESTHDSDGDGLYDNAEGTGWVESWPGGQPHQEIYLALLDRQASSAMAQLAGVLGEPALARAAQARATRAGETIEREYFQPATGDYAFSRNPDGSPDRTATLYPALAWWAGGPGLAHPGASLRRWNSHDFATDWGARDVAESDPVYDPISYHQGSVWPLFTGWAAMADYASGQSLAGYSALRHNADQTYTQDLGAVTELLSGAYFVPFGRSTSHQLWSSAMVLTPVLRGLFGLEIDAATHTVHVTPHLPADWPSAEIRNLHVGDSVCTIRMVRQGARLVISSTTVPNPASPAVTLAAGSLRGPQVAIPLPPVEAALYQPLPQPGARTAQAKVLSETGDTHSLTLELEAQAGSHLDLSLRINQPGLTVTAEGAVLSREEQAGLRRATVQFGPGTGYVPARVVFRW